MSDPAASRGSPHDLACRRGAATAFGLFKVASTAQELLLKIVAAQAEIHKIGGDADKIAGDAGKIAAAVDPLVAAAKFFEEAQKKGYVPDLTKPLPDLNKLREQVKKNCGGKLQPPCPSDV